MSMSIENRRLKLNISRFIVIILILYVGLKFWNQRQLKNELISKRIEKEKEVKKLERDISILEEEIATSDSLGFIEKIARDELGMVKPREIIIIDENKEKENAFKGYK